MRVNAMTSRSMGVSSVSFKLLTVYQSLNDGTNCDWATVALTALRNRV
jgi:hypothetical protein